MGPGNDYRLGMYGEPVQTDDAGGFITTEKYDWHGSWDAGRQRALSGRYRGVHTAMVYGDDADELEMAAWLEGQAVFGENARLEVLNGWQSRPASVNHPSGKILFAQVDVGCVKDRITAYPGDDGRVLALEIRETPDEVLHGGPAMDCGAPGDEA